MTIDDDHASGDACMTTYDAYHAYVSSHLSVQILYSHSVPAMHRTGEQHPTVTSGHVRLVSGPAAFVPRARVRSTAAANRVVVDELQHLSTNCLWYTLAVALRPSSGCVPPPR